MPLMSTCLGRLGSRYSLILDPHRRQVHYGALGLMCQMAGELVIGLDDGKGNFQTLPLTAEGSPFTIVDQRLTMTSVVFEAHSTQLGASLRAEIVAPFWPQDEATSTIPAYILNLRVSRLDRVRWTRAADGAKRSGTLRVALRLPGVTARAHKGAVRFTYPVSVGARSRTGEGGQDLEFVSSGRRAATSGASTDLLLPLQGEWRARKGALEIPFDVRETDAQEFSVGLACHCDTPFFERRGRPMRLKYATRWPNVDAVAATLQKSHRRLCRKSRAFDALWTQSSLPYAAQNLTCLSFQSYLMCTLWAVGEKKHDDWFSVWEGSCWYNSTVDVTFQESMFYFACWPELLEKLFAQWADHTNDSAAERARLACLGDDHPSSAPEEELDFPGAIMEHDMGSGWTANGQSYHHAMPVEENSNFLILLYTHGQWWGRQELFARHRDTCVDLVEYLLWTDSTGNGFPDRGTANTIDDATPAVQYGRDNVYLGIKRLAALHAAGRMFESIGESTWARKCRAEVRRAVRSLNQGWLGDHFPVCLDKSAKGLVDCWSGEPLPYGALPGWDAYSLYTTNGLLPLLLIDDLPPGLDKEKLRRDTVSAARESMTLYGCGHSSMDTENVWVSMNVWRDLAAGYVGENMLPHCERYWAQQLFGNSAGSMKANCFTETSLTNNLVWYPRGACAFGLPLAMARLVFRAGEESVVLDPIAAGRWPLLPLADWKKGIVPWAVVEPKKGKLVTRVETTKV
ncbi:DUF4965 domain-containing protein [bacterium]|nr:DUF4965 domain-containing protein [bacterium]